MEGFPRHFFTWIFLPELTVDFFHCHDFSFFFFRKGEKQKEAAEDLGSTGTAD